MCGVRYGSAEAVSLTETWLRAIERAAYLASAELAAEKGAFPLFDKEKYLAGADRRGVRARYARCDRARTACATRSSPRSRRPARSRSSPTTSPPGIEPVFSFRYTRNVLMPDGSRREEEVERPRLRLFRRLHGDTAPLPDYFVDAQSLAPADHVVMQAAAQKYVDSSISKTINVPADFPFEQFKDVYLQAYELGCKGCTTYRPNEVTGAVLRGEDGKEARRRAKPSCRCPRRRPSRATSTRQAASST